VTEVTNWWQSLLLEKQVFYGIGILSLTILLIQMVLTILGLGGDHDADLSGAHDHGTEHGFSFVTVRTVTAFLVGFGWTGALLLNRGYNVLPAIIRAVPVGAAFLFGTAILVRNLLKLQSSGNLDYANAIHTVGTVYSTIPGGEAGTGQLELMMQGRLITADARTTATPDLKPGTAARVIALVGQSTLIVETVSLP
jgi:hypothetical protein